jgi:peptidoglycan-N-acetylglucosamine deacetylase
MTRVSLLTKLTFAAALLVTITACQPSSPPESSGNPSTPPQATPAPSAAPTASPSPAEPQPTAAPTSAPTAPSNSEGGGAGAIAKPEKIEIQYKMNKAYQIVPIQPEGNKKVVLLTFDDGPKDQKLIETMLDVLDKHQAKAIFFVNGYRVKQNPELLKLIHERGQIIGNHSWDHIDLKKESAEKIQQQLGDVQSIVKELTGSSPQFFRPPFGSGNEAVKEYAAASGMLYMTWSNGSEDWVAKYQNPEGLTKRVMEQLHSGSNILMHELPWTVEALDGLLQQLEEKGFSFVDPRSIQINS